MTVVLTLMRERFIDIKRNNADYGFVYVGLDDDFDVITDYIIR